MTTTMVHIEGYLTEARLAAALQQIVADRWSGAELKIAGSKRRWDMGFQEPGRHVVVEYDGDEHYRNSLKIKSDREKDALAAASGLTVVRIPYWVQLDRVTARHYFGFEVEISQNFPHGFISTKLFPASFCELGLARFERELSNLPTVVREAVVRSLADRIVEHGREWVVPTAMRIP
jgi:hypothetical protein